MAMIEEMVAEVRETERWIQTMPNFTRNEEEIYVIEDHKEGGTMRIMMTGGPSAPPKEFWKGRKSAKRSYGSYLSESVKKTPEGNMYAACGYSGHTH